MEDIINKLTVSFVGVLASWGLMDFSIILACLASIGTIMHAVVAILDILKRK